MFRQALQFINYDKPKAFGATLGVLVAIFLIGQQAGIFIFLTSLMTTLVDNSKADIWVVNDKARDANRLGQVDMRYARELKSIPGVDIVSPLVLAGANAKLRNGEQLPVQLVGVEAPEFLLEPWRVIKGSKYGLLDNGGVSVDVFDINSMDSLELGEPLEISGRRSYIKTITRGARGFGGSLLVTTVNRARTLGKVPANKASAILLAVRDGFPADSVVAAINRSFFGIRAWEREAFSQQTRKENLSNSGIGTSTFTLIIFAIISGMVIIGLTLYSAAIERLNDYATMKAIGASNGYVTRIILSQALLIAIVGFSLAAVLLVGFRKGIAGAGVIFEYGWMLWVGLLLATLLLSLGGALLAIFRIRKVEPASVFR
ncbi:MAG: ABC transporter permease [Lewinellaceae bacterium]|nr:ABC transporter permease [Lewinellaceae bacterium]MCB9285925.1 ABC transporter permease [Lewinellaceae bacterium]